ncbi:MAG: AIR synthase related protein, partial [Actinomycetota bacterium]|nr:AIR synthase related protein [Actinomycetota bacterium]
AACATAEAAGALRMDAAVQPRRQAFFERLGWRPVGEVNVAGRPHTAMRWPIDRVARLVAATKAPLGGLLASLHPGGSGWVGDDAAPVPGVDLVAACDAIMPSMVERDPEWAGWCAVLVNINDLAAMGAEPVGLLDALGAPTLTAAHRVMTGLRAAATAYGAPILGGHTQIGVPAALAVTALGHTGHPIPAGGGRPGDRVTISADLGGRWRPGYHGRQWDSSSDRTSAELQASVGLLSRSRPAAAKDVSMAGVIGTLGMLAEASGCGAELDVAAVPRPPGASAGDWLTCFPGFAMISADRPGHEGVANDRSAPVVSGACGTLTTGAGVRLVWPDGERTPAVGPAVTGMGTAAGALRAEPDAHRPAHLLHPAARRGGAHPRPGLGAGRPGHRRHRADLGARGGPFVLPTRRPRR